MLSPSLTGWQSQYERMKRAHARLSKSYESSIDYDDDLQHFFQDCWHLKDWLKNDRSVKDRTSDIEDKVKADNAHHHRTLANSPLAFRMTRCTSSQGRPAAAASRGSG